MTVDELWQQFFLHLRAKRRSSATLTYSSCTQRVFGRFAVMAEIPADLQAITVTHLRAFLRHLEDMGLAPGGVHGHARALRSVFNWAEREELVTKNPVQRLELPSVIKLRMPTATLDLTKTLLATSKSQGQPLRDAAMILTLFDTGISVQEGRGHHPARVVRVAAGPGRDFRVAVTSSRLMSRRPGPTAWATPPPLPVRSSGRPTSRC